MIQIKHKGAASELIALIWLLNEGYEVFRNVSAHGIADMIAVKDGEMLKIDVKTGRPLMTKEGGYTCVGATKEQIKNDIKILVVDGENKKVFGWWVPAVSPKEIVSCNCGKEVKKIHPQQRWCSPKCRANHSERKYSLKIKEKKLSLAAQGL